MFGLEDLAPTTLNPVTITKHAVGAVVGGALEVLDNTLHATAEYAERCVVLCLYLSIHLLDHDSDTSLYSLQRLSYHSVRPLSIVARRSLDLTFFVWGVPFQ